MSEMVERVARAIEDMSMSLSPGSVGWFEAIARAAIAAMREPSEAMIGAGRNNAKPGYIQTPMTAKIYGAMIDEALK